MQKAVLLICFNRLDYTKEVFKSIKKAKPPRFFIACDGPREDVEGEKEKVEELRNWILDNIDWKCEVKTRFSEHNSGGCAYGVPAAISWFFENEPDGIILEDDCVPNQSFYKYCEELLDKYKNNKKIWHITGYGFYDDKKAKTTYYFSKIQHCWGWATWADRWKYFKLDLSDYDTKKIKNFSKDKLIRIHMKNVLDYLNSCERKETWAWPWAYTIVAHKGYCINPYKNMVSNVGVLGEHYSGTDTNLELKTYETERIIHPFFVRYNNKAIDYIYKHHYKFRMHKDLQHIKFGISVENTDTHTVIQFLNFKLKFKRKITK